MNARINCDAHELQNLNNEIQEKQPHPIINNSPKLSERWLPQKEKLILFVTKGIVILLLFATAFGIMGKDLFPLSSVFSLLLLALLAHTGGLLASIIRLPPLIGMLISGFLFRNLSIITFYENITPRWATTFRASALVVILLKAGLGLDGQKLKALSRVVFQLSFAPCIVETLITGISSHFLLDLPWTWAIMLGFVISAVSPAVIVPGLLSLQSRMLGTKKGIPTLVIAAASMDDILAITGFTVMLTICLTHDNLTSAIIKSICEPIGGFIFGLAYGRVLWYLPSSKSSSFQIVHYHTLLLCLGGSTIMFFSRELGVSGAGPMGCLVLSFIAGLNWKQNPELFCNVEKIITLLWKLLEPFLFSLIGAEVSVDDLKYSIGPAVLAILIGLVFRIITAAFVTFGGGFNFKEKIFIAFAWLPKATVQAAIGSQALDYVITTNGNEEMLNYAQKVLTAAVLSIMMTAPIGAFLIAVLGPKLLTHDIIIRRISTENIEEELPENRN